MTKAHFLPLSQVVAEGEEDASLGEFSNPKGNCDLSLCKLSPFTNIISFTLCNTNFTLCKTFDRLDNEMARLLDSRARSVGDEPPTRVKLNWKRPDVFVDTR